MAVSRTALSPSYSAPRRPVNKTPGNVTIGLAAYEDTAPGAHQPTTDAGAAACPLFDIRCSIKSAIVAQ
jgi:hypothetical protein